MKGDEVLFNEVSPRPHDTGMVTLISQNYSEFALHARAILGLPVNSIHQPKAAASVVIKPSGHSSSIVFSNLETALSEPETDLRLFGKPEINGARRMGVALALGENTEDACRKASNVAGSVKVSFE